MLMSFPWNRLVRHFKAILEPKQLIDGQKIDYFDNHFVILMFFSGAKVSEWKGSTNRTTAVYSQSFEFELFSRLSSVIVDKQPSSVVA